MQLSDADIKEFIEAWKQDFCEELAPEIAQAEATRLLDFFAELSEALAFPRATAQEADGGEII